MAIKTPLKYKEVHWYLVKVVNGSIKLPMLMVFNENMF